MKFRQITASLRRVQASLVVCALACVLLSAGAWADALEGRAQVIEHTAKALLTKMNPHYVFEKKEGEEPQADPSAVSNSASLANQNGSTQGGPTNTTSPSLSWGQKLALDDMERLYKTSHELQALVEDGEEDLKTLQSKVGEVQSAANQVKLTLAISNLDDESRKVGEGLVQSVQELASATATMRRAQDEERRLAQQYRNYNYGNWGYSPWSTSLGWGFGRGWGWGWGWGGGYRGGFRGGRGWCR